MPETMRYWSSRPEVPFIEPDLSRQNVVHVMCSPIWQRGLAVVGPAFAHKKRKVPRGHPNPPDIPYL